MKNLDFSNSILNYAPLMMHQSFTKNPIIDELSLWNKFKSQNLIETKDIKNLDYLQKKAVKLIIFSLLNTFLLNRALSSIKIYNKDFFNIRLIFRIIIRNSILIGSLYFIVYKPMKRNILEYRDYLNTKYIPRYELFNKSGEPLDMNPLYLNDPLNDDYKTNLNKILYERTKSEQMNIIMATKQMELMEKKL